MKNSMPITREALAGFTGIPVETLEMLASKGWGPRVYEGASKDDPTYNFDDFLEWLTSCNTDVTA